MIAEELIEYGKTIGKVITLCDNPELVAVDCGEAPDTNERMRLTADGALLTVRDGRYWQVGEIGEVARALGAIETVLKEKNYDR